MGAEGSGGPEDGADSDGSGTEGKEGTAGARDVEAREEGGHCFLGRGWIAVLVTPGWDRPLASLQQYIISRRDRYIFPYAAHRSWHRQKINKLKGQMQKLISIRSEAYLKEYRDIKPLKKLIVKDNNY